VDILIQEEFMEKNSIEKFKKEREQLNEIIMKNSKKNIKRFFNLDTNVYRDGALNSQTKEMLGLVSSLVLRCDDCILYHVIKCYEKGISDEEFEEIMSIGLVVGGSITIPHIRKAFKNWDELKQKDGEIDE